MIIREINISHDHAIGEPVTMMDYGLKLVLTGVELPPSYEVHFSNSLNQPATVAIGDATGVVVPYEYTEMSGTLYGWLYLHNSMQDGYTERSFAVKIIRRAVIDPPQVLPPQATVIEQAIVALNTAIERTEAARDAAEESATEAEQSAQQAATAAAGAAGSESAAQGYAQQAQVAKTAAETAAGQAEASAAAAASSATAAGQAHATAQAAATRAENAMNAARVSAESAGESAGLAQTAMEESADNAQAAADSATNAAASATSAATSATAAQTAQTAAEEAAGTATGKATEASESAADAAESAAEAEAAATRAEQTVTDTEAWALGAYATSSASGAVATVDDGAKGVPVKALTAYIVPAQDGTGDPSPDNVRPISGWTGCHVEADGKNMFHFIDMNATASGTNKTASVTNELFHVIASRSVASRVLVSFEAFSAAMDGRKLPDGVYTFSVGDFSSNISGLVKNSIQLTLADGTTVSEGGSFTVTSENQPVSIGYASQISFVANACVDFNVQCETGTTKTAYEPYQGNLYPVTWQDVAGTVYGGYFDTVSGVLTVTWLYIASYNGESLPGRWISDRDVYAPGTTPTTGAAVAYETDSPQTYQLSPLEIKTLKGVNNIFADTGDTAVTVRADPDLHINKLIAEAAALALENA